MGSLWRCCRWLAGREDLPDLLAAAWFWGLLLPDARSLKVFFRSSRERRPCTHPDQAGSNKRGKPVCTWVRAPALLRVSVQPGYHINHDNGSRTRSVVNNRAISRLHNRNSTIPLNYPRFDSIDEIFWTLVKPLRCFKHKDSSEKSMWEWIEELPVLFLRY